MVGPTFRPFVGLIYLAFVVFFKDFGSFQAYSWPHFNPQLVFILDHSWPLFNSLLALILAHSWPAFDLSLLKAHL
jgi:hypothetical protein